MRIVLLVLLLVLPSLAQTKGFESWPSPLFVLVVWVEERPDNVNPYVWVYNPTASVVELDENSFSMTDTAGDGMERSTSQAAGTFVSLGAGKSRMMYPVFWKNRGRRPAGLTFRGGDGTRYAVGARAGSTSQGPFGQLARPLREAAKVLYKSHWGEALLESGGLRQAPRT